MVSINIRCSNETKIQVNIELDQTVQQLKETIAQQLPDYPSSQQKLIFSGRVLKDEDVLSTYKMAEGNTVHVIKSNSNSTQRSGAAGSTSTGSQPNPTSSTSQPNNPPANPFAAFAGMSGMAPGMGGMSPGIPGMGGMGGMGGMPGFDPAMLNNMMNNPMMMQMMSQMMSNPQFLDQIAASNPMLAGMMTPEMRTTMQSMFSNPQMLQSMLAMSGGMGGGMGAGMGPFGAAGNPMGQSPAGGAPDARNGMSPNSMPAGFNPFMFMPPPAMNQPSVPPEERYAAQLQQMTEMGFLEPDRNIRALQLMGGNVNAAIEWLFNNP